MLAGICAAAVVSAMFPGELNVSTTLGDDVSIAQGVFMEMFLTSMLIITIFMLAAEKHKATFLAPIGIGLALFVAELVGVFYTGGSLNPARSFGPCVVTRNFPGYHYIYWFGPIMGTLLAYGVYKIIKMVEYQTVNPGQDFDDHEVHPTPFLPTSRITNMNATGRPLQAPNQPRNSRGSRASQRCRHRRTGSGPYRCQLTFRRKRRELGIQRHRPHHVVLVRALDRLARRPQELPQRRVLALTAAATEEFGSPPGPDEYADADAVAAQDGKRAYGDGRGAVGTWWPSEEWK